MASTNAILANLKDMLEEGQLLEDESMEDVTSERQRIVEEEGTYVYEQ